MEKPTVEQLRDFTNGFEIYTFETSEEYAQECTDLDDLAQSIDDNMTLSHREWDTRQVWHFDVDNNIIISTLDEDGSAPDPFCKILIPDDWK